MSLDSLIDAFDAYESIHEDKDDYSNIDFENPIQALDNELLFDIQLIIFALICSKQVHIISLPITSNPEKFTS
ncbi:hypothetical protein C2G38_2189705 [Gigaspora rosea]|uniref:Uncharacterized protein n=1 Tax=Gigaspora rosea TaxID=44941 RepID=A0A397V292_9GLOM|nr:hypothetical protein C2G38_2189705 [Gigaspora rosea]